MKLLTKRTLVALAVTLTLLAAMASPSSAGATKDNAPVTNGVIITHAYHYPNPGGLANPTQVRYVAQNVWYGLEWDGCSQQVRVGYFYGYPYAEMRYISGSCDFGGVTRVTSKISGDVGYPGVSTNPTWNDNVKQMCVVGSQSDSSGCIQTGSGSIWNQQNSNTGAARPLIGAIGVVCHRNWTDLAGQSDSDCLAVSYTLF